MIVDRRSLGSPISFLAPAKINLTLRVLGRRADGYHLLDSLVAFADIGDVITVGAADQTSLRIDGPFAADLSDGPDNLVLRAAGLLAAQRPIGPTAIGLQKNLPVASGIGGGSSDAATTLLALARLWDVPLDLPVADLVSTLGADTPVCLRRRPTILGGIGDQLTDGPSLPPCGIVLVNPRLPLVTAEVFRGFGQVFADAPVTFPTSFASFAAMADFLGPFENALTASAEARIPAIGDMLTALRRRADCAVARLSGSGPTCFGLFATSRAAAAAARAIAADAPAWWVKHGELKSIAADPT